MLIDGPLREIARSADSLLRRDSQLQAIERIGQSDLAGQARGASRLI
jgi:hypothetical protein